MEIVKDLENCIKKLKEAKNSKEVISIGYLVFFF